jgi:hypothetical protein
VTVEQPLSDYGPAPTKKPTINANPTPKIVRSVSSHSGRRFGSSVMSASCQTVARIVMTTLTHPCACTSAQYRASLCNAACCAQPYRGERRRTEQRPASAQRISRNRPSEEAVQRQALAGQSFATPGAANASAASGGPARCRIRWKFPRDRMRGVSGARTTRPLFLHIWDSENPNFLFRSP